MFFSGGKKARRERRGDYLAVTLGVCRLGETGFVYLFDVFNIRVSDKGPCNVIHECLYHNARTRL